jgi:hypothetical protein
MADPSGGTFIDIPKLLTDYEFAKQKLKYTNDRMVLDFWTKEFPASQRSNEAGEVNAWVISKFGAFMSNEMMRNIIGQNTSSFNIRKIMDEGKILLVNLSKGRTGDLNSKLLGMIFVMKFQAAAMSRANIPESQRRDFCLYVDEFQNYSSESFATILSEARKFKLNLIVANQFTTQLQDEVRDAVFGNIGTIISHRVGNQDAEVLEKYFRPIFDIDDLQQLPNHNTIVKMLISGVPTQPFSMASLPPLGHTNKQLADALRQLSSVKYGRPRAKVEKEIFDRLTTQEPEKPAGVGSGFGSSSFGGGFGGGLGGGFGSPAAPPKPAGQGSFLDDWLAKRKAQEAAKATPLNTSAPTNSPTPPLLTPKPAISTNVPLTNESSQLAKSDAVVFDSDSNKPLDNKTNNLSSSQGAGAVDSSIDKMAGMPVTNSNNIKEPVSEKSNTGSEEVISIAEKLKANLRAEIPKDSPEPIADKPNPIEQVQNDPVKIIAKSGSDGLLKHDDTIHIDNEGKFTDYTVK